MITIRQTVNYSWNYCIQRTPRMLDRLLGGASYFVLVTLIRFLRRELNNRPKNRPFEYTKMIRELSTLDEKWSALKEKQPYLICELRTILRFHQNLELLLCVHIFTYTQWFCKRAVKALISLRMRRLIRAFTARLCSDTPKTHFRLSRPKWY